MLDLDNARAPFLLDGATGTNLFAMGLANGEAPEFWNIAEPDKISALHDSFFRAGSDAVLTNSFGANRQRLKLHKAENRVAELNLAAVTLARAIAEQHTRQDGKPRGVFGSIGPTGELIEPLGALSADEAQATFVEQAEALAEAGVDGFWIETLSSLDEAEAALRAVSRVSKKPIFLTMSFDTVGKTMMGVQPESLPQSLAGLDVNLVGVGANCGLGPAELLESLIAMRPEVDGDLMLLAKSNYGVPQFRNGGFHYHGTPDMMAEYTRHCCNLGVGVIGGCCGTTPELIGVMRRTIDRHQPGDWNPDKQQELRDFIANNRASAISSESTEPISRPRSGRRSGRRSR